MKKVLLIIVSLTIQVIGQTAFSESLILKSVILVENLVPILDNNSEIISKKTEYNIHCEFQSADTSDSNKIKDAENWKIHANGKPIKLEGIKWYKMKPKLVKLIGPFGGEDKLTVAFLNGETVLVDVNSATVGKTKWGFGTGKAIDLNVKRLTTQTALWAFDYNFKINILENNLTAPKGNIWFRSLSLSLSLISNGTIASDDKVRNGTQSSIELIANPLYFVGRLEYGGELSFGYQLETKMNEAEDKLFDIINKQIKLGLETEIPFTNYPIFKLHTKVPYARVAMPLTLSLNYLFEGDDDGNDTPARVDFKARYELAFSPYLIVHGEWHVSKFFDAPAGFDDTPSYYSIAFAQDLDVVKKTLGFLKFILGPEEEIRGNNFIFFRISNGRKAPAFEDINEKSIGFATYF